MVTSVTYERLGYLQAHLTPSGKTGAANAMVVRHESRAIDLAQQCVKTIDSAASGVFCIDLRENRHGQLQPTEINCGRFFTASWFWTRAGANLPYAFISLADDERAAALPPHHSAPDGQLWIRRIDADSTLICTSDLDGISQATSDGISSVSSSIRGGPNQ